MRFKEQSRCMVYQYGNYTWELAGGQNVSKDNHFHTTGFLYRKIMNVNGDSLQMININPPILQDNCSGNKMQGLFLVN